MSRFVNRQATDEIVLTNGDTLQVRQRLTAAEDAELTRNLVQLKFDAKTGEAEVVTGDWHLMRQATVRAYVVTWDFKDDEGNLVAYATKLVDTLDSETVDEIAKAIDGLQTKRKDLHEKKVSES